MRFKDAAIYGPLITVSALGHVLYGSRYRSLATWALSFSALDLYERKKHHQSLLTGKPLYQGQIVNQIPKFQSGNDTFTKSVRT
jgi:hypothetical protein